MPYFKDFNLLFIHIPKTGGSNIENFFFNYLKQKPSISNLLSNNINLRINNHSLQHMTYLEMYYYQNFFNIDFNNKIKIITVVRNPYDRILSDIFYLKFANKDDSVEHIEKVIKIYLESNFYYDNHKIPQCNFLLNEYNIIESKIIILKCEKLNEEMKNLGFPEFSEFCNFTNSKINKDYSKYLNKNSINLINEYYKLDFIYFDYQKIEFE